MPAQIRQRKSTITNVTAAFQDVAAEVQIPEGLNQDQARYYRDIAHSREVSSWSAHDRNIATLLAKTLVWVDHLHARLEGEGPTQRNERGTEIANPVFAALTQSMSQVQSLTRTLGLGASQRGLSGHRQAGRNKADAEARDVIAKVAEGGDLLA